MVRHYLFMAKLMITGALCCFLVEQFQLTLQITVAISSASSFRWVDGELDDDYKLCHISAPSSYLETTSISSILIGYRSVLHANWITDILSRFVSATVTNFVRLFVRLSLINLIKYNRTGIQSLPIRPYPFPEMIDLRNNYPVRNIQFKRLQSETWRGDNSGVRDFPARIRHGY